MEPILRAEPGWEERLAHALRRIERPIAVDPRFAPRDAAGRANPARYVRGALPPARAAATLLLLYPDQDGELMVPLTVRHAELRSHAGEVSLPGGAVEAGDADRAAAALREAHEEVGVEASAVRVLGHLDDVWIPVSNYQVRPFVGSLPHRPLLIPQMQEVAAVVELPVRRLLSPDAVDEEEIDVGGFRLRAAAYRYGENGSGAPRPARWRCSLRSHGKLGAAPSATATVRLRDGASGPWSRPAESDPGAARAVAAARRRY